MGYTNYLLLFKYHSLSIQLKLITNTITIMNKGITNGALWHDKLRNPYQEVIELIIKGINHSLLKNSCYELCNDC